MKAIAVATSPDRTLIFRLSILKLPGTVEMVIRLALLGNYSDVNKFSHGEFSISGLGHILVNTFDAS